MPYGYFCNPVLTIVFHRPWSAHSLLHFTLLHHVSSGTDDFHLTFRLGLCRNVPFPGHITFPCLSDALSQFHKTGTPEKLFTSSTHRYHKRKHICLPQHPVERLNHRRRSRNVYQINVWEVPSSALKVLKTV